MIYFDIRGANRAHIFAELADLSPDWCRYGAVAVLRAFFDESGTHTGSPVTTICGFLGSRNQWRRVGGRWRQVMGGRVFHYKDMRTEDTLLDKLSTVLADSGLEVVGGGFVGDWERAIHSGAPDWSTRFPSCYSMIMEMTAQRMESVTNTSWHGEPIAVTFSRQDEYAKRAEEVWRTFKGNGFWPHITTFAYGSPDENFELQAADMIAHETFQCLKESTTGGWGWDKWPLVRKLLDCNRPMHGFAQTEEQFVKMLREQDQAGRQYLGTVEKPAAKTRRSRAVDAR
jgi:hypothetical protein